MSNPHVPGLSDLASDTLRHRFEDSFNPPALTNFLGAAQVDHDLVGVRSVNFPPLSSGDTITGQLFLDGRLFRSLGAEVAVTWRPDRVTRTTRIGELELETVTACPPDAAAVVVDVRVRNPGGAERKVRLGLAFASTVTRSQQPWLAPSPPSERNRLELAPGRRALVGLSSEGGPACAQGLDVAGEWMADNLVELTLSIPAGETRRFGYVHVLGESRAAAVELFDRLAADVPAAVAAATSLWERTLASVFEGGDAFSGVLPVLETESEALRRLYWTGLLGVVWFRRDSPHSVVGRTYDTLMPRYWQTTTFIWDYSLSSIVHALLDPEAMRRHLEHWISTDIHTHFGTEWLTGGPVGVWYSVNDFAMTRLVRDYVRYSGDRAWLDRELPTPTGAARSVEAHVREWASHWRSLRNGHALADYGGVDNLLECVSTYTNEVASLNATNVWCLRVAAEIAALRGNAAEAASLREEAAELAAHVLELYVDGAGYWGARRPDGRLVPVRHCYDFATTGFALADDLGPKRRRELVEFFRSELQTGNWMRALSASDPDAAHSVRLDHQWNGAYTAWPADAATALIRLGAEDVALDWLPGLARSANQGPFAQGHFVDGIVPASHGGAPKGPPQFPYLMDWACSSSGAYVALVLEGVFGLDVGLDGEVRATPRLSRIDPSARLRNLVVGGKSYDVTSAGATPV
jgi:hypothetical protein